MQKSIVLTIFLLFLASCTMMGDIQNKAPQTVPQIELIPKKEIITTSDIIKNFGSGFVLTQNTNQTTLNYSGTVIKTWLHTPPQRVPFIWDDACDVVWKGFEKLEGTTEEGKQSVWDALSEQEKKTCLAENLMKRIDVHSTQNQRFFIMIQVGYENALRTLVDIQTLRTYGGMASEVIQENIQNIIFVDGHILFLTRSNFDASDELLIFSENFEFQKKWVAVIGEASYDGYPPHTIIKKIENISQTGATLVLDALIYTSPSENHTSSRREVISF